MWEKIKSRQKSKCGNETKVVKNANVGAKTKVVRKKQTRPTQKGQPHPIYVLRAK